MVSLGKSRHTSLFHYISPPHSDLHAHQRTSNFYLSVMAVAELCTDPLQNSKTQKQARDPLSASRPQEADMISCYPCFPPSIKAYMHHVNETWTRKTLPFQSLC